MQILRASEDYLETMLMMKEKHGYIRSIDIAEYLGVTKPSVSYATKRLRESGYITMDKTGSYSQEYRDYIQLCVIELMFNRLKIDRQIISDTVQNMSMTELLIYREALEEQIIEKQN